MIRIDTMDVGHGGCTVITCPNGARVMIDCGCNASWFPSVTMLGGRVDLLILSHLDEDHVEDLPYLWKSVRLGAIFSNPTVSARALERMKQAGGMGPGIAFAHNVISRLGSGLVGSEPDLGGLQIRAYWNRFGEDFQDTNNLSVVTFARYGDFTMLFAGDLETPGWRSLLRYPAFAADLASVNVFVTSHHGRQNGCCEETFWVCRPQVFFVSDQALQWETQETTDWYRRRAVGVPDFRLPPDRYFGYRRRYVLTTRHDGTLTTWAGPKGNFMIVPFKGPSFDSRRGPAPLQLSSR